MRPTFNAGGFNTNQFTYQLQNNNNNNQLYRSNTAVNNFSTPSTFNNSNTSYGGYNR
jgi:hypothetical protein